MMFPIKQVTLEQERARQMAAYDRLPPAVREMIANSAIYWRPADIEQLLNATPVGMLALAIRMEEDVSRRDHEHKIVHGAVRRAA